FLKQFNWIFMNYELIYNKIEEYINKNNWKLPFLEQKEISSKDAFFVTVAVILSARTKDTTTVKICNNLFKEIRSFKNLSKIPLKDLEKLLYGIGFYKTKAKNLKKLAEIIIRDYNSIIPNTIEELIKLPGIGRKSANLIIDYVFSKDSICVDVHVHRIQNRIGIVKTTSPKDTEKQLRQILPQKLWSKTNYIFVVFGQNLCLPRGPKCALCPINNECKKIGI
ncbi:MAG: endonuclease III, partial [archaeon]